MHEFPLSQKARIDAAIRRERMRKGEQDEEEQSKAEPRDTLATLNSGLQSLQQHGKRGMSFAEAWELYELLPESKKDSWLKTSMIDYLSCLSRPVDAMRLLRIFNTLEEQDRSAPTISAASLAKLILSDTKGAVLLNSALYGIMNLDNATFAATSALMVDALSQSQWQLVFHLWNERIGFAKIHNESRETLQDWKAKFQHAVTHQIAAIGTVASSLVSFAAHYPEILQRANRELLLDIVSAAFARRSFSSVEEIKILIGAMEKFGLSRGFFYDVACIMPFSMGLKPGALRTVPFDFYYTYRSVECFKPKRYVIERLISHAVQVDNEEAISLLKTDWHQTYGKLSARISRSLMLWHSRRAETEQVESLMEDHIASENTKCGFFYPCLHSDALRGGGSAVKDRLRRMVTEYRLMPDIHCHNILLHGYARFDDLEGALDYFSLMLQAEIQPDSYTIGTLMGLCADRGDYVFATSLFRYAIEREISVGPVIYESLVLTLINADNTTKAIELAEELTPGAVAQSTRMWTQLIATYASTQRRPLRALRLCRRARELGVPFDDSTFAALMRAFVELGQLSKAKVVMRHLMPHDGLRPSAIHYAIMIQGCAQERYFEAGLRLYARMLEDKVKPSHSVRFALLQLQREAAKHQVRLDSKHLQGIRFDVAEELLEDLVKEFDPSLIASKEPQIGLQGSSPPKADLVASFDTVIQAYGRAGGSDMIRRLTDKCLSRATELGQGDTVPRLLRFLLQMMRMRHQQRDFKAVVDLYEHSHAAARARARPAFKVIRKTPHGIRLDSTSDMTSPTASPSSNTHRERSDPIPAVHRHLFSRHLDLAIRALAATRNHAVILDKMRAYTASGFALDYLNWNTYVQMLASSAFTREAFAVCETRLMPAWKGWRTHEDPAAALASTATRRKQPGLEFVGRPRDRLGTGGHVKRRIPDELLERHFPPEERGTDDMAVFERAKARARAEMQRVGATDQVTYETMVRLRAVLDRVAEAAGREVEGRELFGGGDGGGGGEGGGGDGGGVSGKEGESNTRPNQKLYDELRETAPKTVHAAERLPGTELPWVKRTLEAAKRRRAHQD